MLSTVVSVWQDEEGGTMVEYGLMTALIALICIVVVSTLGSGVKALFSGVQGGMLDPSNAPGP